MPKLTYAQVQEQIAKLQAQAAELRKAEVESVIARIHEAIDHYQLTPADIFGRKAKTATTSTARPKRKSSAKKSGVLYKDAEGNTWGGRGPRPAWIKAHLEAGKTLDELRA